MNDIEKLTEMFIKFPGIGGRQARRFVQFLLTRNTAWRKEFINTILSLENTVQQCPACLRYSPKTQNSHSTDGLCSLCSDSTRDHRQLLVVEKDVDIDAIEKSGVYNGLYFVLGGTIPLSNTKKVYAKNKELYAYIQKKQGTQPFTEIILALSLTVDGEYTAEILTQDISRIIGDNGKISILGRGLSTGSEIEYADSQTIKNALKNRF